MKVPKKSNVFEIPDLPEASESFQELARGTGIRIERILSRGHKTPAGKWYDQDQDEWVALLQGEASLEWEDGQVSNLEAGDWLLIPANCRHRVSATSSEPPCVWLAVHADLDSTDG